ncbi:MAG: hypothetical protein V4689_17335 [Verrucomicrobiota bacterium]
MNTPEHRDELEKLLGRMKPSAPDALLMERLRAARPAAAKTSRVTSFPRWIPLAAAACLAGVLGLTHLPRKTPIKTAASAPTANIPAPPLVPLESSEHLMGVTDFGIVHDSNDRPVRLIAATWLDETTYASSSKDSPVTRSRVRQEILPVSIPIY